MPPKPKRPIPDPEVFFTRIVPRVMEAMRGVCAELGGRYAVVLRDAAGATGPSWTMDFAAGRVEAGQAADVVVTLTRAQLDKLSTGKAELKKWVADGEAPCEGDRDKLENLSLVLAFLER